MKTQHFYRALICLVQVLFISGSILAQGFPVDLNHVSISGEVEFRPAGNGSYLLKATSSMGGIEISDPVVLQKITSNKYLIIRVKHHNPYSGFLTLEFFAKDPATQGIASDPRMTSKIGVLPDLSTYVVFPFEYLNGQEIFLSRTPRQLKGVVFGHRINPEDIAAIKIIPGPFRLPDFEPEFNIDTIFLSNEIPVIHDEPGTAVVDQYGQWNSRDWPGKTHNETEFAAGKDELTHLAAGEINFEDDLSRFGGWKNLRFDSTGFFHTHFDGNRWWFVDPDGFAFLSNGMDCVRPSVSSVLQGNEDLYGWIPSKDSGYASVYSDSRGLKMIDFFQVNMIRMFGQDWKQEWMKITRNKLVSYGFNTVGNWSDGEFSRQCHLPYVLPLAGFPSTEVSLFRDFPDVFSPQYKVNAEKFATQLREYRDDPYLIGYFLRNEPQWAFGDNDIAFEMFAVKDMSFSKRAFVKWLTEKYGDDLSSFNTAWKLHLGAFSDLNEETFKEYPSTQSREDFKNFTGQLVDKYVGIVCREVRKVDPNHLNLGMRYAFISSDLLYRAGQDFDVFSINSYTAPGPSPTKEIYEKTGKPVMIGEFHFGAIDRGLPSTGLRAVASTSDRGKAYRCYIEDGFSRPELIGIHYFQWMDQPVAGRFDGENYNIGFNDIVYHDYPELVKASVKSFKRIYLVASGKKKAFTVKVKTIPVIAF